MPTLYGHKSHSGHTNVDCRFRYIPYVSFLLRPPFFECQVPCSAFPSNTDRTMASSSPLERVFDRKISVGALLKANDITLDVSYFEKHLSA